VGVYVFQRLLVRERLTYLLVLLGAFVNYEMHKVELTVYFMGLFHPNTHSETPSPW